MSSHRKKKIIRTFQKYATQAQDKIRFTTSHITTWGKITLFWIILCSVSLFLPWISSLDSIAPAGAQRVTSVSSFSPLLGYSGVFIAIVIILILFSIFSIIRKQKFHAFSLINLSGDVVWFWGSIFIFIFTLHSFFLIHGLQFFSGQILFGSGVILCMTGAIVTGIGSVMMMQENRKNIKGSYVSEIDATPKPWVQKEGKKNMKLPF